LVAERNGVVLGNFQDTRLTEVGDFCHFHGGEALGGVQNNEENKDVFDGL